MLPNFLSCLVLRECVATCAKRDHLSGFKLQWPTVMETAMADGKGGGDGNG
jgi:hypothetical protein